MTILEKKSDEMRSPSISTIFFIAFENVRTSTRLKGLLEDRSSATSFLSRVAMKTFDNDCLKVTF